MRMTQWHTHVLVIGHVSKQEEGCWNSAWCQSFYLKILQMKWRRCTRGRDDTSDTRDWDIWYWDLFVKIKRGKKPRSGHSVAETSNWGLIRTVFIQARFMEPPLSQHFAQINAYEPHSLKPTWPLKIGHPKRKLVFQPSNFRCYASFREGKNT